MRSGFSPARLAACLLLLATFGFGGCAQQPQQLAASHGKEYFPSSKYGPASRRVVADGQPIPRGGGQYLVGKPYTVAGQTYYPSETKVVQVGNASWYGDAFHGRLTANGEIYDKNSFTAAHPTMPLPSYARVTNLRNNSSMIVRVNDRGPYASNRIMDVSGRVAEALDFKRYGTAKIKVEYVGHASLAGSDDARLFATLRTNGPAQWQGEPTMVAAAEPRRRTALVSPDTADDRSRESDIPVEPTPRLAPTRHAEMLRDDAEQLPRRSSRDAAMEGDRLPPLAPRRASTERSESRRIASLVPEPPVRGPERHSNTGTRYVVGTSNSTSVSKVARAAMLPPARPMDLGTIPGADSPIHAHHVSTASRAMPLRLARSRDD